MTPCCFQAHPFQQLPHNGGAPFELLAELEGVLGHLYRGFVCRQWHEERGGRVERTGGGGESITHPSHVVMSSEMGGIYERDVRGGEVAAVHPQSARFQA